MAAEISAVLDGSVLRVTDTNGDDRIVFHRSGGQVTIENVAGSWAVGGIDSVQIQLGDGDDYVSIRRLADFEVTVTAGTDNERAKLADGRDVYFGGLTTELEANSGIATLNSQAIDWFDTHLADTTIREIAKSRFEDSVLDRRDMIRLFGEVADNGRITETEYTSLRVLVRDNSKFVGVLYVQVLSKYIVLGNRANRHYQGKKLGNLDVGSSGEHLDKLVNKWFLGKDHPLATVEVGKREFPLEYEKAEGRLFASSIKYTQVMQGALADCYLLAPLAEAAKRRPNLIRRMFIDNGDGTFTVRYFQGSQAQFVTVDRFLPVDHRGRLIFASKGADPNSRSTILWVALAEKAYVQMNESGWLRRGSEGSGENSYQAISFGSSTRALRQIGGVPARENLLGSRRGSFATFLKHYRAGQLITFASRDQQFVPIIAEKHAYAVIAVNARRQIVTLYNPWGFTSAKKPGLVKLNWNDVKKGFGSYSWSSLRGQV